MTQSSVARSSWRAGGNGTLSAIQSGKIVSEKKNRIRKWSDVVVFPFFFHVLQTYSLAVPHERKEVDVF